MEEQLPLIAHKVEAISIDQRAVDGYINATALCQASGKRFSHYLENKGARDFLVELTGSTGIPADQLIQIINVGPNQARGTWVHPQVAINLGQWASPKFAVLVSKWVFEWMSGGATRVELPNHVKRYLVNRGKIPPTHFSMLDQMTLRLLAGLEQQGYSLPNNMMPDISLGRMFSGWCRENGYDPEAFPSYMHEFVEGHRPTVQARLYPNELMTAFNLQLQQWMTDGRALKYFSGKDKASIEPLQQLFAALPPPAK